LALLRADCARRDALDVFMAAAREATAHVAGFGDTTHREHAVRINGPLAAPMPLRAGRHRAQLLLEATQRSALRQALAAWLPQLQGLPQPRGLRWSIDVDPVDLY
jgi:primosomal protein N' (replication factor Y)